VRRRSSPPWRERASPSSCAARRCTGIDDADDKVAIAVGLAREAKSDEVRSTASHVLARLRDIERMRAAQT